MRVTLDNWSTTVGLLMVGALFVVSCGTTSDASDPDSNPDPDSSGSTTTTELIGEPPPGPVLLGGGSSFGECLGWCVTELTIDAGTVTAVYSAYDGTPDHVTQAELTDHGLGVLAKAQALYGQLVFDEVYGCPDCADGGAEWVSMLHDDDVVRRVTFEYGQPPDGLLDASRLNRELAEALATCTPNDHLAFDDLCVVLSPING